MLKSQVKQLLLAALFGPLGVLYTSTVASLVLTLSTLIALYFWPGNRLLVIAMSIASAVLAGCVLAIVHNRKAENRNFRCSGYIGRVSCKVIGPTQFKRDYNKPLARVRRYKRLRTACMYATTCAGGAICAIMVYPDIDTTDTLRSKTGHQAVPIIAAARAPLEDTEIWQVARDTSDEFQAVLRANDYQTSSVGLYRPKLQLSCANNKTALTFIAVEVMGTGKTRLKLGFDQQANTSVNWHSSEDYQSANAPRPIGMVRKFKSTDSLQIAYWPFGQTAPKTATFNLSNSDQVVDKVRSLCVW